MAWKHYSNYISHCKIIRFTLHYRCEVRLKGSGNRNTIVLFCKFIVFCVVLHISFYFFLAYKFTDTIKSSYHVLISAGNIKQEYRALINVLQIFLSSCCLILAYFSLCFVLYHLPTLSFTLISYR